MAQVRMPWYEYEPLLTYGCTRSRPGVQVDIFILFLTNIFMLFVNKYIHPKYHYKYIYVYCIHVFMLYSLVDLQ